MVSLSYIKRGKKLCGFLCTFCSSVTVWETIPLHPQLFFFFYLSLLNLWCIPLEITCNLQRIIGTVFLLCCIRSQWSKCLIWVSYACVISLKSKNFARNWFAIGYFCWTPVSLTIVSNCVKICNLSQSMT